MLYRNFNIDGTYYPLAVDQEGEGIPTDKIEGSPGILYFDKTNKKLYQYIITDAGVGNWVPFTDEQLINANRPADAKAVGDRLNQIGDKLNQAGNALVRTVTGSAVAVDDVSPLEHQVKCTVSGVPDPSVITVTRCGKNIFDPAKIKIGQLQPDGIIVVPNKIGIFYDYGFQPGIQYTIIFDLRQDEGLANVRLEVHYADGTVASLGMNNTTEWKHFKWTSRTGRDVKNIQVNYGYAGKAFYRDLRIILGVEEVPYEKYTGSDYHPDIEGDVVGMASLSPAMTVLTDTPGALLDVTYNRDSTLGLPKNSSVSQICELKPNEMYVWDEIESLTITLAPESPSSVNEYMFQFKSPINKPTNLVLPKDIKWVQTPLIVGGKTYQVSILNGIGVIAGV